MGSILTLRSSGVYSKVKITRHLDRDGTLGPLALNYLAGISAEHLFFREQRLRHLASIYNLSIDKLTKAFVAVVDRYAADTSRFRIEPNGGFNLQDLCANQEDLLRCLQEHLDDCFLILKTLVDPSNHRRQPRSQVNIFSILNCRVRKHSWR